MLKKNKKLSSIAMLMIMALSALMTSMPLTKASVITTYGHVSATPNPIGVGQTASIIAWISPLAPGFNDMFHDITITITHPDGTTEDEGSITATQVGAALTYVPDQIGDYTFVLNYPGETFASSGDTYSPCTSPETILTVQQEPIQPFQENPLPTEYWSRPINAEHRNWASISGDWLMGGYNGTGITYESSVGFNPYSQAPRSAHIMWTNQLSIGGLVGGDSGSISYYPGLQYEVKDSPPIIMDGRIYYNSYPSAIFTLGAELPGFKCVDLRTGEELWSSTIGQVTIGQEYYFNSPDQSGVVGPYIWNLHASPTTIAGSMVYPANATYLPVMYQCFDASTGTLLANFTNGLQGSGWGDCAMYGSDGTLYVYILDGVDCWLAMWNSTKAFEETGQVIPISPGVTRWRPTPGTYDWMKGIEWNVTIPDLTVNTPDSGILGPSASVLSRITGNTLLASVSTFAKSYYEVGYSLDTGEQLWVRNTTGTTYRWKTVGEGIYAEYNGDTRTFTAFSVDTGEKLWESDPEEYPWGFYNSLWGCIAYGRLYALSFDGYLHCFNISDGKQLWKFYAGNSGFETPYGSYPLWYGPVIAGGVAYVGNGEHTPTEPLARGYKLFAVDAYTGQGLWNISGMMQTDAIADGYLLTCNAYDNRMYCFGKGPSATTVTAPDIAVDLGKAVMIKGSVIDIAAGTSQNEQVARFPNGVPAVSDESMSGWMEYVYMQKPKPTDVTGVEVVISVLDSNGNYYDIGNATTDDSGMFSFMWTPEIPGEFTVVATFAGSESYYGSYAKTAFGVMEEPAATAEPTPIVSMTDMYFLPTSIGIIIAIVAVGAVLVLMLRKR